MLEFKLILGGVIQYQAFLRKDPTFFNYRKNIEGNFKIDFDAVAKE